MRRLLTIVTILCVIPLAGRAQGYNQITDNGQFTQSDNPYIAERNDSVFKKNKKQEIPRGLKVWTVDERFGDRMEAVPDTVHHMFMNTILNGGVRGEYSSLGNIGSPRLSRIFIDRSPMDFIFLENFDMFIVPPGQFHYTNTMSPITNVSYNTCGSSDNGEDHFKALFAANLNKKFGFGFKFDYIYGKGYYEDSNTSHFNFSTWASYLGDRYQAHLLFSTNHQKLAENGGILDDEYITHPESKTTQYKEKEIPVTLDQNWNQHDNQHLFFSHRYIVGFNRKVPMTEDEIKAKKFAIESAKENAEKNKKEGIEPKVPEEPIDTSWMKNEYVPVTSFIHTLNTSLYRRIYKAYETPKLGNTLPYYRNDPFYDNREYTGDSIYDKTRHYYMKNTLAIALLEGFNKYAKAGLKVFAAHELKHYEMPDMNAGFDRFTEHNFSVGGQLQKTLGRTVHYNAVLESFLVGADAGSFTLDGEADLNFPLFGDTVTLAAKGFIHRASPSFFFTHYHSKYLWWDNDIKMEFNKHIEGLFTYQKTRTTLRVAYDNLSNYTYLSRSYSTDPDYGRYNVITKVNQASDNISVLTLQLAQDFTLGPLNWENMVTYQKSSNENKLPLPDLNIYTNLYLKFRVAHVLDVHLGADMRYFTSYYAPDYSPLMNTFAVQDNGAQNIKLGNFPEVDVYANLFLKHARFFVMLTHVNYDMGSKNYFQVPHYPLNQRIIRFGVSWNFFN